MSPCAEGIAATPGYSHPVGRGPSRRGSGPASAGLRVAAAKQDLSFTPRLLSHSHLSAVRKTFIFRRQLSGEASPGQRGPACLRARTDFPVFSAEVALGPDLDYRWRAPDFFPCLALFLSEVGVFPRGFGDLQIRGSSGRCGTAAAPPLLPMGSLLLSTPVLAPSPCRPPAWDARGVSPPPRSPPPTAPEPLAGFAGRGCKTGPAATQGAGRSGGFEAGLRRGSADGGLLLGPKRSV